MSITNTLLESDVKIYLTGGTSNTDPNLSLGGGTSTTELLDDVLDNLFNRVDENNAVAGITQYRCFTIKNTHADKPALKCKLFFGLNTTSPHTEAFFGIGAAGINQDETLIDPDTEEPPVNFVQITEIPDIANIGDLLAGDRINIWIRWVVNQNAESTDDDKLTLRLLIHQEQSDEEPDPPTLTCPDGEHYDPITDSCVPDNEPIQCPIGSHYDETLQTCVPDVQPPPAIPPLRIAAVGDFDCNSRTDDTFDNIINNVVQNLDNPAGLPLGMFIPLGDMSYGSSQDCWLDRARNWMDDMYPMHIFPIIGNHDDREDGSRQKKEDIVEAFPHIGPNAIYSVKVGNIKFMMFNTQDDYDEGSGQYDFMVDELEDGANDPEVRWMVACYHKPSIATDDDNHSGLSDFRDTYHPLFDQYGVNLALSGHNHNYMRTYPLEYKSSSPFYTILNATQGPYIEEPGVIYITVGTGGRRLRDNSNEPFVAFRDDQTYGILVLEIRNEGKELFGEFISNDNETIDQFTLRKQNA